MPLHVSQEGKQRLQVGISWDTRDKWVEKGFIVRTHEKVTETYDLDLLCYIYDADSQYIEAVMPDGNYMMDESEQIYHSGDNTTGRVGGDDEYISVNLRDVPEHIHRVVFVVTSPTGKPFRQVNNAEARVADGKSDETQLHVELGKGATTETAFIFAEIYRDEQQPNGWALREISQYCDNVEYEDWPDKVKEFLAA